MSRDAWTAAYLECKRQGARSVEAERAREQRASTNVFGIENAYMGPPVGRRTNTTSGFYAARAESRRRKWEGSVARNRSKYAAWKRSTAAKYSRHADEFWNAANAADGEPTPLPRPRKEGPTYNSDRMGGSRTPNSRKRT